MFNEDDKSIQVKYEDVRKEWEAKRQLNEKYKRMRENQNDFDYFADNAQW